MTSLIIDEQTLALPLISANPTMLDYLSRSKPNEPAHEPLAARVKSVLRQVLPSGRSQIKDIAKVMGMSSRSLQRGLKNEGWTYHSLLAEARRELALYHLNENRFSIVETAYLLGYRDASSFHRAYKNWTGQTPKSLEDVAE